MPLSLLRGFSDRAKSVQAIQLGTVPAHPSKILRNIPWRSVGTGTTARGTPFLARASSRTTVTKFAAVRRYRFFSRAARESRHARALHYLFFAKNAALEITAIGHYAVGHVMELAGGHTHLAEIDASWRLLLPLLEGQSVRKLRQDVRNAEICVAMVGHLLREIAKPLQRKQSWLGAAPAASGSRRTRAAVTPYQNRFNLDFQD